MKIKHKGLTLIEVVISLAILGFVMGLIFYLLNTKVREAVSERSYAFMQSEIQLASEIIRWDLQLVGFGLPSNAYPLNQFEAVSPNNSDSLILRAAAFITQRGKWSYVVKKGVNTDKILVYKWNSFVENFDSLDYIIILMADKEFVAGPLQVISVKETTYVAQGGATKEGLLLKLNSSIQRVNPGYLVFQVPNASEPYSEVHYSLDENEVLRRSGEEVIRNVRLFKVDLKIDTTGKEDVVWVKSVPQGWSADRLRDNLKLVQISLILHSPEKDKNYLYPSTDVSVFTPDSSIVHTLHLTNEDRHYKWIPLSIVVKPRNLFR